MNDQIAKMIFQAQELEREAKENMVESMKERKLAKIELKRGNRAAAQLHAQNCIRYEKSSKDMLLNVSSLKSMISDLIQSQNTEKMAENMNQTTKEMSKAAAQTNIQKVSENRNQYDQNRTRMQTAHQLLTNEEGQEDLNAMADGVIDLLDVENIEDANAAINDIPIGMGVPQYGNQQVQAQPAKLKRIAVKM
ncbi:SNF7 family protein [Tritrichomonas foetus]|uniref:SNF7 family protein n=1 Tax=Tritrichomonas foetus TaxID=1144522 RepID=A0A1J4JFX1_9EUKA|nr:SNF7 family protein [Tritrichomonas foetus]|eukprot:OHS98024.1 SNF7 family protein [Tritrichomonas foetus]